MCNRFIMAFQLAWSRGRSRLLLGVDGQVVFLLSHPAESELPYFRNCLIWRDSYVMSTTSIQCPDSSLRARQLHDAKALRPIFDWPFCFSHEKSWLGYPPRVFCESSSPDLDSFGSVPRISPQGISLLSAQDDSASLIPFLGLVQGAPNPAYDLG